MERTLDIDQLIGPMGGEEGIKALVDHFYDAMDSIPEVQTIRKMHPHLEVARERLFDFLVFRFGGDQRYLEKRGHPRMRARHFPFAIGPRERDQWLYCMDLALKKMNYDQDLQDLLFLFFTDFAEKMRNRD
ncbi:MAG: group II truncated hemoglobin [Bdellovibrio sp.]